MEMNIYKLKVFLNYQNIHDLIDGSWSVDIATHNLNDNGFVTSIKAVSL